MQYFLFLNLHEVHSRRREEAPAPQRYNSAPKNFRNFFFFLWANFAFLDMDPQTQLNPDPIRIWIRNTLAKTVGKPGPVLLQDRLSSPWSFVLSLAYVLGESLSPRGALHRLKLGLLLSLVSGEGGAGRLHLLARARDTCTISRCRTFFNIIIVLVRCHFMRILIWAFW
jgi:hypothetical protein